MKHLPYFQRYFFDLIVLVSIIILYRLICFISVRDRKSSGASSSSVSTNNDEVDHSGDIWVQITNRVKLKHILFFVNIF